MLFRSTVRTYVRELATRPLPVQDVSDWYATSVVARLLEHDTTRQISALQGRLQRLQADNAEANSDDMVTVMAQMSALDAYRRQLREIVAGETG